MTRPIERAELFSEHFGIGLDVVQRLGFVDVFLNRDARLFIDPRLIETSQVPEIREGARASLGHYFTRLVLLLRNSTTRGDLSWREAVRSTRLDEVRWTRLGYVREGNRGSGMGSTLTAVFLQTAKAIVDLGIVDPRLFHVLPLLEEGIGPDRISDLTTNIILDDLCKFTARCCGEMGILTAEKRIRGKKLMLPVVPGRGVEQEAVILVPRDVVADLPLVCDFEGVVEVAELNEVIRDGTNRVFGGLIEGGVRLTNAKEILKGRALSGTEAVEVVIREVMAQAPAAYNFLIDPKGEFALRAIYEAASANPLRTSADAIRGDVKKVANAIVEQFKFLVEDKAIWKSFYADRTAGTQPLEESVAQDFFKAIAFAYCGANDVDVTPEAETGRGPVDFKLSRGGDDKAIVEVKKSTNTRLVEGYMSQITTYQECEEAKHAVYLVVDVGKMGTKMERIVELRNRAQARHETPPDIFYVDARPKPSASKE